MKKYCLNELAEIIFYDGTNTQLGAIPLVILSAINLQPSKISDTVETMYA